MRLKGAIWRPHFVPTKPEGLRIGRNDNTYEAWVTVRVRLEAWKKPLAPG